MTAMHYEQDVM